MTSSISGLSSSLIYNYEKFQSVSKLTTENMFQMLSLELGSDGEKITKKQLDSYIEDAKDGSVSISNQELDALKDLQENWDYIAGKENDSITYKNMNDYRDILFSAVTGGISVVDNNSSNYAIEDIDQYLINETLKSSIGNKENTSVLISMLENLLLGTTDEKDDENANLIGTLVNLIAAYDSNSTINEEA